MFSARLGASRRLTRSVFSTATKEAEAGKTGNEVTHVRGCNVCACAQ